jgi:hypothetical protein
MTRTALALLAAFALAACDQSTSAEPIPSGTDAPRLTVTVLTGTKAAPVDTPTVKVEWAYADSLAIINAYNLSDNILELGSGSLVKKIACSDSVKVKIAAMTKSNIAIDTSKSVYCK